MSDTATQLGKLHRAFLNEIVAACAAKGMDVGITDPNVDGRPTMVVAKRNKGWRGHLPGGFRYDLENGVLFRAYNATAGEIVDRSAEEIVDGLLPAYMEKVKQVAPTRTLYELQRPSDP